MSLKLYEQFLLLSIDKIKGKFLIDSLTLNYGLSGAILMELSKNEYVKIDQKKIVAKNIDITDDRVLNTCLTKIRTSEKLRNAKYWVNKFGSGTSYYKKQILANLCEKKILLLKKNRLLWIFTITRYPILEPALIDNLKNEIKEVVLSFKNPESEQILLLSLINSCKLTRLLFPEKHDYKKANKRIKELTKNIEIGEAITQTIKEIQSALIVASTTAFIAANSASG